MNPKEAKSVTRDEKSAVDQSNAEDDTKPADSRLPTTLNMSNADGRYYELREQSDSVPGRRDYVSSPTNSDPGSRGRGFSRTTSQSSSTAEESVEDDEKSAVDQSNAEDDTKLDEFFPDFRNFGRDESILKEQAIGPEGGKISLHSSELIVPSNMVVSDTRFEISVKFQPLLPFPYTPICHALHWQCNRILKNFNHPVTIKFQVWARPCGPMTGASRKRRPYVHILCQNNDNGEWRDVTLLPLPYTCFVEYECWYFGNFCAAIEQSDVDNCEFMVKHMLFKSPKAEYLSCQFLSHDAATQILRQCLENCKILYAFTSAAKLEQKIPVDLQSEDPENYSFISRLEFVLISKDWLRQMSLKTSIFSRKDRCLSQPLIKFSYTVGEKSFPLQHEVEAEELQSVNGGQIRPPTSSNDKLVEMCTTNGSGFECQPNVPKFGGQSRNDSLNKHGLELQNLHIGKLLAVNLGAQEGGVSVGVQALESSNLVQVSKEISYYENQRLSQRKRVFRGVWVSNEGYSSRTKKEVAVKLLLHLSCRDEAEVEEYLQEVENMNAIEAHSNVARIVHHGKIQANATGGFYIAMDLCHSKSLVEIDLKKIPQKERKNIFVHVCKGVRHLHGGRNPLAHMDLKPSNILFSLKGDYAVVADFGLSKIVEIDLYYQHSSSKHGASSSTGWKAAEVMGEKEKADSEFFIRADIFSLGLLGVYILTGVHPFAAKHNEKSKHHWEVNISDEKKPDLSRLEPLEKDLFERMLSHDPSKRPSIVEVLKHCMFWTPATIGNFFHVVYGRYFRDKGSDWLDGGVYSKSISDLERPGITQKEKQILEKVREVISPHWLQKMTEANILKAKDDLATVEKEIATMIEGENPKTLKEKKRKAKLKIEQLKKTKSLVELKLELDKGKIELDKESKLRRKKTIEGKLEKMRKDYEEGLKSTSVKKDYFEDTSLVQLLRYIRNNDEHANCRGQMKYVISEFPKLLPFVIEVMRPHLEQEHEEEYFEDRHGEKKLGPKVKEMLGILKPATDGSSV